MMKKDVICLTLLVHVLLLGLNGPLAMAWFQGKKLTNLRSKLAGPPESISLSLIDDKGDMPQSESGGAEADGLSISLLLSDLKERTGDLSQMVRYYSNKVCGELASMADVHLTSMETLGGVRDKHGSSSRQTRENNQPLTWFDGLARKFCLYTAGLVGIQSLGTILSNNEVGLTSFICFPIPSHR